MQQFFARRFAVLREAWDLVPARTKEFALLPPLMVVSGVILWKFDEWFPQYDIFSVMHGGVGFTPLPQAPNEPVDSYELVPVKDPETGKLLAYRKIKKESSS
eukprot:PhM_4_TR16846/c0_g1_i1/m.43254